MEEHGAALAGRPVTETAGADALPADHQTAGGVGFELPPTGEPRRASLTNPPQLIPEDDHQLYIHAADEYAIPLTLLAGIGMAETNHGRLTAPSSAGAQGLMQFMPATWATMGVDGDGDGRADIHNDADSIHSAANYLTHSGVHHGTEGVRQALFAYNHADWYVNDVLHYAHAYGGGLVLGSVEDCNPDAGDSDPDLPHLNNERVQTILRWALSHDGDRYVFGGNGPDAWDCSSFTQAAVREAAIDMPRTAGAQRDWLAAANGRRIQPGHEQPGDLIFWDSFLGPHQIGHVVIVLDPIEHTTIEARSTQHGVGTFTYTSENKNIYEIWRIGDVE